MNSAFALIDNGSLAAEPHRLLRRVAAEISRRVERVVPSAPVEVQAVSWKHSHRAPMPDGGTPWVLDTWVPAQIAAGATELVFVPFFVSPQGAIGGALRADLEAWGIEYRFTEGLAPPVLGRIAAERVQDVLRERALGRGHVIVVDHGGPSPLSAAVRNQAAAEAARLLGDRVASVTAASMESPDEAGGPACGHNRPLLARALGDLAASSPDQPMVVAPLFLAPGRHAGPGGDLARIAAAAAPGRRIFFTDLIGSHPLVPATLAAGLQADIFRSNGRVGTTRSTHP